MLEACASLAALPGVRICLLNSPCLSRADGILHVLERKGPARPSRRREPTCASACSACVTGESVGTFGTPNPDTRFNDWFVMKLRAADGSLY
jgi:hypothetical protein